MIGRGGADLMVCCVAYRITYRAMKRFSLSKLPIQDNNIPACRTTDLLIIPSRRSNSRSISDKAPVAAILHKFN